MTTRTFRRLFPPAVPAEGSAFWLLFHGVDLLMPSDGAPRLLTGTAAALDGIEVGESFLLGTLDGLPLLVGVLAADAPTPAGYLALGLRGVLAHGDAELIGLASYATHLTHWNRTSHFCPTCGPRLRQWPHALPAGQPGHDRADPRWRARAADQQARLGQALQPGRRLP